MGPEWFPVRRLGLVLAAGLITVGLASPATAAPAEQPTPPHGTLSGKTVPGPSGKALSGSLPGNISRHFRDHVKDLVAAKKKPTVTPQLKQGGWTGSQHVTWGVTSKTGTAIVGAAALQSVNANGALPGGDPDVIYAPTLDPNPSKSCIELTTVYWAGGKQVMAWNWCAAKPGFEKGVTIDSTFLATYTTGGSYNGWVTRTDAAANTWTAYLYNYKTKAWDTFFTSKGTSALKDDPPGWGWDMWEVYTNYNAAKSQGYYCDDFKPAKWTSGGLQYQIDGKGWTAASKDNSNADHPRIDNGLCNDAREFQVVGQNNSWLVDPAVDNGEPENDKVTSLTSASGDLADLYAYNTEVGAEVRSYPYTGTDNQRWHLWNHGDGYFMLENRYTELNGPNGANARILDYDIPDGTADSYNPNTTDGSDNQLWAFQPISGHPTWYSIRSKQNGNCLRNPGQNQVLRVVACGNPDTDTTLQWKLNGN